MKRLPFGFLFAFNRTSVFYWCFDYWSLKWSASLRLFRLQFSGSLPGGAITQEIRPNIRRGRPEIRSATINHYLRYKHYEIHLNWILFFFVFAGAAGTCFLQPMFIFRIYTCYCLLLRGKWRDCIWTLKLERCQTLISSAPASSR